MGIKPLYIVLLVTGVALLAVGVTLAFTLQSHEPTQVPSQEYQWLPPTQTPPTQQQPEYKPPTPAPTYEEPGPTPATTVKLSRGQYIIAQDDTYLGMLDSGFASKSIFNDFGKYGSEFSSTSIWNDFSKYGSEFSSLSAFNDFASKPPMLFDGDNFICYVTTNTLKMPRVSPYSLIAFAESMGWE
jgi:hypothetical protein